MSPAPLSWAFGSVPHGSSWLACRLPQKLLEPLKTGLDADVQHKDLLAHLVSPSQQAPVGIAMMGCPVLVLLALPGDEVTQPWLCRKPHAGEVALCEWWRVLVSLVVMVAETMTCPAVYPHILHALHPLCYHAIAVLVPQWHVPPLLLFLRVPVSLTVPPSPLVQAA